MSRITRRGIIPVNQITPLTYRDGVTYIEMLTELSNYIRSILQPSLQSVVDSIVADIEQYLDQANDRYIEGVREFQRIHDAFMEDVNSHLVALNDGAITDLVTDDTSKLGKTLRDIFATHTQFVEFEESTSQRIGEFEESTNQRLGEFENETRQNVTDVLNRISSHGRIVRHTEHNITGGDVDQIHTAIAVMNPGDVLTIPEDMVFDVSRDVLLVDQPVTIRGGVYQGDENMVRVTVDGVCLENMVIEGPGNDVHTHGTNAVYVEGTQDNYISFCARGLTIRNVGYTGFRAIYTQNFVVEDCLVEHFRYAGIAISSSRDGVVTRNISRHAVSDERVNHNSYGISISNGTSVPLRFRCENIEVSYNTIDDVPNWEGIDTHNGKNISMMFNTVRGCRRGIALVANMPDPMSGPTECNVIGNFINCDGASQDEFNTVIGITMGGNSDGVRKSDAVITNNTIVNAEQPILFHNHRPQRYSYEKCSVQANVTDKDRREVAGTVSDTGWIGIADHMEFGGGVGSSGDYQTRIRVVSDDHGWTTYIRGAVTRSTDSNLLFRILLNDEYLVPSSMAYGHQDRHIIGRVWSVRSSDRGEATLFIEPDRRIRFGNATGDMSGSLFVDAVIRA